MQSDGFFESECAIFGVPSFLVSQSEVTQEVGGGGVDFETTLEGGNGGGVVSESSIGQTL